MVDQRSSVDKIVPRHPLDSLGCVYYNPVMWPNLKDPKLDELSLPHACMFTLLASPRGLVSQATHWLRGVQRHNMVAGNIVLLPVSLNVICIILPVYTNLNNKEMELIK